MTKFIPHANSFYDGKNREILGNLLDEKLRETPQPIRVQVNNYTLVLELTLSALLLKKYYGNQFDFTLLDSEGKRIICKQFANGFQFITFWSDLADYGITQPIAQILNL